MLDTLRAEAALHGFTVRALTLEQCTPAVLRSIGPSLIAVEAPTYSAVVDTVWSIGTPLVVLERRPRAQRTSFVPPLRAGMAVADITDGFGSVFDVAERVLVQGSWAGATILAVDDDPAMLMMVRYVLEAPGIQVISESDPAAVRALIAQAPPTLLLLDVNMPGLDGIEFARSLRQDPGLRDMAILMLSGESDAVHRARALDAGADDFVPKPIVPVELRMRVHSQLERRRLARLAEGIHPGTGLSLAARTQRDAEEAWGAALRAGRACSVFVIRADAEPVPDNDAAAAPWLRETVRVARALGHDARSVGHHDGNALLGVLQLSGSQASDALNLLARSGHAGGVAWHAGVVDAEDLMTPDFPAARRAAEDAADLARTRAQAAVHRWQRGEALAAPDVIVVEDDPALSEMLQYALRATGFTSRAFDNGRVALQELLALRTGATRPFVLLDVDLPGMDGYTLHERLREERPGAFDVVFITVHASESDQLRALRAGAMDYIMKPLNLRILMAKMSSWRAARDRGA
jgi:DNA-binding response OmpR family regulator